MWRGILKDLSRLFWDNIEDEIVMGITLPSAKRTKDERKHLYSYAFTTQSEFLGGLDVFLPLNSLPANSLASKSINKRWLQTNYRLQKVPIRSNPGVVHARFITHFYIFFLAYPCSEGSYLPNDLMKVRRQVTSEIPHFYVKMWPVLSCNPRIKRP